MIQLTLGPPPVAAGATGTADTGAETAQDPAGGFSAALRDAASPSSTTARDGTRNTTAAGPDTGKLPQDPTADAGGQDEAERIAAAIQAALAGAVAPTPAQAPGATPVDAGAPVDGDPAAAPVTAAPGAVPAAAVAVPATAVAPAVSAPGTADPLTLTAALAAAPAAPAAAVTAPAAPSAAGPAATPAGPPPAATPAAAVPVAPAAADPAALAAASAPDSVAAVTGDVGVPKGAATLTLTMAHAPAAPASGAATAAPAGGDAGVAAAATTGAPASAATAGASGGGSSASGNGAGGDAPAAQAAPVADTGADAAPPAGATGATAVAPARTEAMPAASAPGAAMHAALAKDISERVHVAVREGGREIILNLHPQELGRLTVRVVMNDGLLQAHIVADRPESAKMLEQAMSHLSDALSDQGYTLQGMDVSYNGEARQRSAMAMDGRRGPRGLDSGEGAADDDVAEVSAASARPRVDTSVNLDLLV